jgi:hypothetical protein
MYIGVGIVAFVVTLTLNVLPAVAVNELPYAYIGLVPVLIGILDVTVPPGVVVAMFAETAEP